MEVRIEMVFFMMERREEDGRGGYGCVEGAGADPKPDPDPDPDADAPDPTANVSSESESDPDSGGVESGVSDSSPIIAGATGRWLGG